MLTDDERLALLKAIEHQMKPIKEELEGDARRGLMERFGEDGTDRRAIIAGGQKVGEVGISYSKPRPFIYQDRTEQALDYLEGLGLVDRSPAKGWESHFKRAGEYVICVDTGEMVDFIGWQGKEPKNAAIRGCEPEEVREALRAQLQSGDALALLEGGGL